MFGLVGRKGVGKDTAADYLVNHHGYTRLAFADPLKDVVSTVFCIPREIFDDPQMKEQNLAEWGATPRRLLQVVGTELFRDTLPVHVPSARGIWIKNMEMRVTRAGNKVVITDVRFPDEADLVRRLSGTLVEITRNTGFSDGHVSESTEWHLSETIDNNGTIDDLHKSVEKLLTCGDA